MKCLAMKCLAGQAAAGLVALALLVCLPVCRAADDPRPKPEPAEKQPPGKRPPANQLDDDLLRELGDEPAAAPKDKPKEPPPGAAAKPSESKPSESKPSTAAGEKSKASSDLLDDDLLKQLEGDDEKQAGGSQPPRGQQAGGDGPGGNGPIERLTRQMRDVQQRLQRKKSDADTQQLEKKILAELEKMIEQASNQSSSSSSSSSKQTQQQGAERDKAKQPEQNQQAGSGGKQQNKPARDSSQRLGKAKPEKPDMARLQDLMKDIWGELPPRLRQQMMQSSVEHFVPKYEFEIEEYFKTLAERQQEKP
jgi:hypothetical protein